MPWTQLSWESRRPYQSPVAAKVLLILPRILRVVLFHLPPHVVRWNVPTAACPLTPPPVSCGLSQDKNFFSPEKTELQNSQKQTDIKIQLKKGRGKYIYIHTHKIHCKEACANIVCTILYYKCLYLELCITNLQIATHNVLTLLPYYQFEIFFSLT